MKIRYPAIISMILFASIVFVNMGIPEIDGFLEIKIVNLLGILWLLSLLWVAYAVIAKICRTIYRAVKSRENHPEKSPLEP